MNRGDLLLPTICLGLFSTSCASQGNDNTLKNSRPNIIFIYADDWGYGDLSAHGHTGLRTPNLDQMIAEGTEFNQFNVCSPVSSSSRTAILTGHFPSRHNVHEHFASATMNANRGMPNYLDPSVTLLPRLLKEAGYKTAHYGKWHLTSAQTPNSPEPILYGYDDTKVFNGGGPQVEEGPQGYATALRTENCVNYTIDFIEQNKKGPFYVNLWLHESHQPIEPSPEMLAEYPDVAEPQRSYYSVITSADKQVGRLFDYLKSAGLEENTLVIFSSDNGPETPGLRSKNSVGVTGGQKGRKRSLFEGGVRVPFIVRMPGTVAAGEVDNTTMFAAVDMLPTLCSIAGVELPDGYMGDGEDVSDLFVGKEFAKTKPVLQYWQGNEAGDNWPRLGAKDNQWKLVSNFDGSRIELYDYLNDWSESNNVAAEHPEVVKQLLDEVMVYYNSLDLPHKR